MLCYHHHVVRAFQAITAEQEPKDAACWKQANLWVAAVQRIQTTPKLVQYSVYRQYTC